MSRILEIRVVADRPLSTLILVPLHLSYDALLAQVRDAFQGDLGLAECARRDVFCLSSDEVLGCLDEVDMSIHEIDVRLSADVGVALSYRFERRHTMRALEDKAEHALSARRIPKKSVTLRARKSKRSHRIKADVSTTDAGDTLFAVKKEASIPHRPMGSAEDARDARSDRSIDILTKRLGAVPPGVGYEEKVDDMDAMNQVMQAVRTETGELEMAFGFDTSGDEILLSIDGLPAALKTPNATRRFIHQGPLKKMSNAEDWQERQFFLFSDVLVWCKQKLLSRKFVFKGQLWLDGALLVSDPIDIKLHKLSFTMIGGSPKGPEDADAKVYVLRADTLDDKLIWTRAMEELVARFREESAQREKQKARVLLKLKEKDRLVIEELEDIKRRERRAHGSRRSHKRSPRK